MTQEIKVSISYLRPLSRARETGLFFVGIERFVLLFFRSDDARGSNQGILFGRVVTKKAFGTDDFQIFPRG